MQFSRPNRIRASAVQVLSALLPISFLVFGVSQIGLAQQSSQAPAVSELTPMQREIERQRQRLSSSEKEARRDAVMRLGGMKRAESSRVAASALKDSSDIVRATAASAVLSLPPDEAAAVLLPLLLDKKEFVRQETAYALGKTKSRTAVDGLVVLLERDKDSGVRGAAAVALGMIADESAVGPLSGTLAADVSSARPASGQRRRKKEDNEFVLRAAAHSLGQITSPAAVPALIAALDNERIGDDVRREAALSLGLIGDVRAVPALRAALIARDPYLSRAAHESLSRIAREDMRVP